MKTETYCSCQPRTLGDKVYLLEKQVSELTAKVATLERRFAGQEVFLLELKDKVAEHQRWIGDFTKAFVDAGQEPAQEPTHEPTG